MAEPERFAGKLTSHGMLTLRLCLQVCERGASDGTCNALRFEGAGLLYTYPQP